jgi:hypothetical protein
MKPQLWGCYSVADHLEPRAFVADLLLYDRLVVPVPVADDMQRWVERWDPERQARLLAILGSLAVQVKWTEHWRKQVGSPWSPGDMAMTIDGASSHDPYWRHSRSVELLAKSVIESIGGEIDQADVDVRAIAVYAKPDHFDREWQLTRTLPFVNRVTRVTPGAPLEVAGPVSSDRHHLAKVVVTRLVVPDEGKSDEEVLQRTVELVQDNEASRRRAEFQDLLASLPAGGVRDETVVGQIESLIEEYNKLIRRRSKAWRARTALLLLTTAEAAVALKVPAVGLASGLTAALGEAEIRRRLVLGDEKAVVGIGAVSLLAEAQRALG